MPLPPQNSEGNPVTDHDSAGYFEPLRRRVTIDLAPADAFRLFTERISTWWPLRTYSLSGPRTTRCEIEPRVGGRVFEVVSGWRG